MKHDKQLGEPEYRFEVNDQGEVEILSWFRVSPDDPRAAYMDLPPEGLKAAVTDLIRREHPNARSGSIYFLENETRVYFDEEAVNDTSEV